jgi:hypothetical protein
MSSDPTVYVLFEPDTGSICHVYRAFVADGAAPPDEAAAAEHFREFGHAVDELRLVSVDAGDLDFAVEQRIDPDTGRLVSV